MHQESLFVTLTYAPEHLPHTDEFPTLDKGEFRRFIKRLRKALGFKIRYFGVGEYGDLRDRPHYHAIIFGLSFDQGEFVHKCWGLGQVQIGTVTLDSVQYVAGYTLKKMTSKKDSRLKGREPEFSVMSRRPGIGFGAVAILSQSAAKVVEKTGDVPHSLRHGPKMLPLGRYMIDKLRAAMDCPDGGNASFIQYLNELRRAAVVSSRTNLPYLDVAFPDAKVKIEQKEKRFKIFKHNRDL